MSIDPSAQQEMAEFPEMNPGPVMRMDGSGQVLLANRAARKLFGGDRVLGRTWNELFPNTSLTLWERVLAGEVGLQHETEIGERSLCFTLAHLVGSDFVFAYGSDVTNLKLAERTLAEQAAALAEMARFPEMNPGPVCRVDHDAVVVLANGAARELFGGESLLGESWLNLCPGVDAAFWGRVLAHDGETLLEARIGGKHLLFTHRPIEGAEDVFVYGADITTQKTTEVALRQSEKMATLGTLAAGVAHELNNPAAAAQRAAEQLRYAFTRLQESQARLGGLDLQVRETQALTELDTRAREQAACPCDLDPLARSDRESEVEDWLDEHDVEDAWELAPSLVSLDFNTSQLDELASRFSDGALAPAIAWLSHTYPVYSLLEEIRHGAGRVSEIVAALKSYSYVGQAPVQAVDVNEGIRNTLVILRNKLKQGIHVEQHLAADLPRIQAFGSELNQVWTNLIDNAADAMGGRGRLVIRSAADDGLVRVEVEDDGPGIPSEIQSRIFDPFTVELPLHRPPQTAWCTSTWSPCEGEVSQHGEAGLRAWLSLATSGPVVWRGIKFAPLVGAVLIAINDGDAILKAR